MCLIWSARPAHYNNSLHNICMAYRISAKTLILFGKNVRKIRESQKRDQVAIADEAGIDTSYFARIERGEANPTLEVLYAIVKALHITSSKIFPF